jgi:tyrosyl-tRNA synthetase
MAENLYDRLRERGYIYQCTNEDEVRSKLSEGPLTFYLGIDPTADSLHIGHFFALRLFRHLQNAGHRGILLIGGATAMVGDPSGKSDMRKMMAETQVERNIAEVKELAARFILTTGDNPALIVNNADWTADCSYITFLRKVGAHFNVSVMLAAEAYAKRLTEGGLTFMEMGYMLMQAYDFVHLNENYGCTLQIGGSDQWGKYRRWGESGAQNALCRGGRSRCHVRTDRTALDDQRR